MGASSSQSRPGRRPQERSGTLSPPANMPPHLANQYRNRPQHSMNGEGNNMPFQNQPLPRLSPEQHMMPSSPQGPPQQNTNGENNGTAIPTRANQRVQEGQIVKMLATIDASSVKFDPASSVLRFSITSTCSSLTYEVHTGVKEFIKGGDVFYMPNKPKVEPPRISLEGALNNKSVAVRIDVSVLEEKERVYNKHYPKQQPCVVVLRYRTRELRKPDDNPDSPAREEIVEQTEHTAIDLADNPRHRVISQIVTAGGSAYVVENLFGVEGELCTAGGAEVTIGNTLASHDLDDDDDGLCVICLTVPKDTAVMPCRHMCLCKECAKELMWHTPKCPVCRGAVSTLLHMPTVNSETNNNS